MESYLKVLSPILLAASAVIGDYSVSVCKKPLLKAICDNCTHFIIGGLSWLVVVQHLKHKNRLQILEVGLCAVISSLIDLDHFLSARSFNLKDAVSLSSRPPLHCTSIPVLFCATLCFISKYCHLNYLSKLSFIVLVAFLSHHIRDANRRGLWFCPFGSTRPLPYFLYVGLIVALPFVANYLLNYLSGLNLGRYLDESEALLV